MQEARNLFRKIHSNLPTNFSRLYVEVTLKRGCRLYIPLQEKARNSQEKARAYYQDLVRTAEF